MRRVAMALGVLVAGCGSGFALNPSLDISQYGHNAWTVRDGFSVGTIFAMAQTPDGYLWLGAELGLFRFDGIRSVPWQPPAGQHLPSAPYSLLVTRDGTLWIGTFAGLVSWNGGKLTRYPELGAHFVTSLLEDREGTVWAGTLGGSPGTPTGRLCAIRSGQRAMLWRGWRLRLVRLEFGRGQLRHSLGWRGVRALAMETRSSKAICDGGNAHR